MGRLIDADELEKYLNKEYYGMISDESMKIYKILQLIDEQPTAYDVEKVVSKINRCSGNGYRDVDGDYVPPMIETGDAIRIITEGGVED